MNYLELLKNYTKAIEVISQKLNVNIEVENGQFTIGSNEYEILIDPEFHTINIEDNKNENTYYFDLESRSYKNDESIESNEFIKVLNKLIK